MNRKNRNTSQKLPLSSKIMGDSESMLREKLEQVNLKISELEKSPYTFTYLISIQNDLHNKENFLEDAREHLKASVYNEAMEIIEKRRSYTENYRLEIEAVKERREKLQEVKESIRLALREIEKNKQKEEYLLSVNSSYKESSLFSIPYNDDDMESLEAEIMVEVKAIERKNKLLNHTIEAYNSISKDNFSEKDNGE